MRLQLTGLVQKACSGLHIQGVLLFFPGNQRVKFYSGPEQACTCEKVNHRIYAKSSFLSIATGCDKTYISPLIPYPFSGLYDTLQLVIPEPVLRLLKSVPISFLQKRFFFPFYLFHYSFLYLYFVRKPAMISLKLTKTATMVILNVSYYFFFIFTKIKNIRFIYSNKLI